MYELPTSIKILNEDYPIRNAGDYRVILDCFSALQDIELSEEERVIASLVIFYEDALYLDNNSINVFQLFDTEEKVLEAVKGMYNFFNCNGESVGNKVNYRLIDWDKDSQMIASAVNKVAGTEIRSIDYLHWWTFMGDYGAVGESTLSTVVTIRQKIMRNKKLEKYENEFRHDNPQFFTWNSATVEQQEADAWVQSLWDNNN